MSKFDLEQALINFSKKASEVTSNEDRSENLERKIKLINFITQNMEGSHKNLKASLGELGLIDKHPGYVPD
jgi:hypothetical protein